MVVIVVWEKKRKEGETPLFFRYLENVMFIRDIFLSLESSAEAEVHQEIEYTFFGKVENFDWINEAASSEQQEQWEIHVDKGEGLFGSVRIRATNDQDFVFCTKVKTPGVLGKSEAEQATTRGMFESFRKLATSGLKKTRYNFPVPDSDLVWEIDVFETKEGKLHPWVKIDLEVTDVEVEIPPLPIEFLEKILNQDKKRTPAERDFVTKLFSEYGLA